MGYRDDTIAFRRHRDLLSKEVDELVAQREELGARQASLKEALRSARAKLALVKLRRWIGRHPVLTTFLLLIAGITTLVQVEKVKKARARERRAVKVLGTGCATKLEVSARPPGNVYVNGAALGETPVSRAICPGRFLVQVTSRKTMPWQRKIDVRGQKNVQLHANLINLRHRPGDAMVIHTEPENAVIFVDGVEVGLSPVLVRRKTTATGGASDGKMLVGLWAPGHLGRGQRIRFARDVWFHLAPAPAEAPSGGGR